jgi:hypothetical protein
LDPHLIPELDGTKINYRLRNQQYELTLGTNRSAIAVAGFTVRSGGSFAVNAAGNRLACFSGNQDQPAITLTRNKIADLALSIDSWPAANVGECRWTISYPSPSAAVRMVISGLRPRTAYRLQTNGVTVSALHTDADGRITVKCPKGKVNALAFALTQE